MDTGLMANAATMTAIVVLLVSLITPFVESVPALSDTAENKARHDAALRGLNVLLNVAVVFLVAAATSTVTLADVLPLVVQALAQSAGAHFAFHVVTQGPTGVQLGDAQPGDFPPGAPSVAALGLPTEDGAIASGEGQQVAA